ncbi:MAG: glycosyltransferase family 4 protein [Coprobacter sp.]|nr:glycosyltransferase family 4 protein [Coprobacter sp.]
MIIGFDAKRANANRTGLGNYSRFVIDALASADSDIEWAMYIPREKPNAEYKALLNHKNVSSHLPQSKIWRTMASLWRTMAIVGDLQKNGVMLFHGLSNELPIGLSRKGIRGVVTIHDLIFLRYPRFYKLIDRKIYTWKFRRACKYADKIVAVSECTKRDIVKFFGIDPDKIVVIYQGCDSMFSASIELADCARVKTTYTLPDKYIITVGTLEERKNLQSMVEALVYLPADVHLVAVGRATPYTTKVMQEAGRLGLSSRIHLLHNVAYHDLPALYKLAEVMVYPSYFEGFGIPIIEAMNVGVPVVAATGSCLEEAGGPSSLYVSPDDSKALADAILRILDDSNLASKMIADGKEYVRRFSKEKIAEDLLNLYSSLLPRTRSCLKFS